MTSAPSLQADVVQADVVIVGGAVMGSSAAYHLLADSGFKGRVVVVEKDPTYQLSASALSAPALSTVWPGRAAMPPDLRPSSTTSAGNG